jgi:ribulose-phosphate 3-epimerase
MARLQLAPSILTADFSRLGDEIRSVMPYVDWFHLDVMDGHYVGNLTFGPLVVEAVRRSCDLPLHVHLMIEEPAKYIEVFTAAGATRISFHPEVVDDPAAVIHAIRDAGAGPGIAVHPDVGLETVRSHLEDVEVILMMTVRPGFGGQAFLEEVLPKIAEADQIVKQSSARADVEIDGGVNLDTVDDAVAAGGNVLVAGSAVFDGSDAPAAARRMRERLKQLGGHDGD